jgi:hypothetical protein
VLQEPWITVAEKAGCRLVSTTFFHGTWVADRSISAEAYDFPGYPEVEALRPEDFNLGRIQLREPGPIPEGEARWAWEWMASWGVPQGSFDARAQINRKVVREARELAAADLG